METLYRDIALANKRFLVAEHVTQDLSPYSSLKQSTEVIALENLQRVITSPYTCGVMHNLVVGDQLDKTAHDLQKTIHDHNVGFIVDLTTRYHGLNIEKLKTLSDMLQNVRLMYGYTPKVNGSSMAIDNLEEKLRNEIEFEMKNGSLKILPSFIGELIINDLSDSY